MWADRGADGPVRVDLRGTGGPGCGRSSDAGPDAGLFSTEVGIGQYGVTVLDHANGMATFAAGGKRAQAHFVREVTKAATRVYAEQLSQSDIGLTGQQVDELTATLSQVPSAKLSNGGTPPGRPARGRRPPARPRTPTHGWSATPGRSPWRSGSARPTASRWSQRTADADVFGSTHPATIWRQFMHRRDHAPRPRSGAQQVRGAPTPWGAGAHQRAVTHPLGHSARSAVRA